MCAKSFGEYNPRIAPVIAKKAFRNWQTSVVQCPGIKFVLKQARQAKRTDVPHNLLLSDGEDLLSLCFAVGSRM